MRDVHHNNLPENANITIDALFSEEIKLASKSRSNKEVFDLILSNIAEVNIAKEVGVSEKKVRKKDELVIIIDKLLLKAKELKLNLGNINGTVYLFNKSYWSKVDEAEFQDFLADVSKRAGLSKSDAEYYKFKLNLFEQFISSSRLTNEENEKMLINLANGTLEIVDGKMILRDYDPEDFLTYKLDFNFEPEADCPKFDRFLNEVLPDESLKNILAEYLGSVFIPNKELKIERVLFLYGTGANGKSVVFEIIQALLGNENLTSMSLGKLTTCANSRLQLQNKLLNYSSEKGEITDMDMFKKLASREPVDVKILYKNVTMMYNYARMMFNCNDFPKKNEYTNGYFRRFMYIPFDKTIEEKDQDKQLASKIILDELPGVLNWMLNGMQRLIKQRNFTYSKRSEEMSEIFRRECDSVMMFKEEYNLIKSQEETKLKDLYSIYREFCLTNGFKSCANNTFSTRLKAIGFEGKRKNTGQVFYITYKL